MKMQAKQGDQFLVNAKMDVANSGVKNVATVPNNGVNETQMNSSEAAELIAGIKLESEYE